MYDDVMAVLDGVRVMVHRAVAAVERVHADSGVTAPMRAVLEYVRREGAESVAAIARARGVSRQHIQAIVNDLLAAGLVARIENPNHRRSPLIGLTDEGARTIDALLARERAVLAPLLRSRTSLTADRLEVTAAVVGELSEVFATAIGRLEREDAA